MSEWDAVSTTEDEWNQVSSVTDEWDAVSEVEPQQSPAIQDALAPTVTMNAPKNAAQSRYTTVSEPPVEMPEATVTPTTEMEMETGELSPTGYETGRWLSGAVFGRTSAAMAQRALAAGGRVLSQEQQKIAPVTTDPGKMAQKAQDTKKVAEMHGVAAELLDPTWYNTERYQKKLEKIREKDPTIANSFQFGGVAAASNVATFKAFLGGEQAAKDAALANEKMVRDVSAERQTAADKRTGLGGQISNLTNSVAEMTNMLATGAAVSAVPVIGPLLSSSMWAMQGGGDIIAQAKEQGADDDAALGFGVLGGIAYAGIESLQLGQILNIGTKKAIGQTIKRKILGILVEKGIDAAKETLIEEGGQGVIVEEAIISALKESGIAVDDAMQRRINAYKESVAGSWKEMGLLSLLGAGAGAATVRGNKKGQLTEIKNDETGETTPLPDVSQRIQNESDQQVPADRQARPNLPAGKILTDFKLDIDTYYQKPEAERMEIFDQLSPAEQERVAQYQPEDTYETGKAGGQDGIEGKQAQGIPEGRGAAQADQAGEEAEIEVAKKQVKQLPKDMTPIDYALAHLDVKTVDEFSVMPEEEQAKRFELLDYIARGSSKEARLAADAVIELNKKLDEKEKVATSTAETQKKPEDYSGKTVLFKGLSKKYKGKDVTKVYEGVVVSQDGDQVTIERMVGGQPVHQTVSVDRITDAEGTDSEPIKKSVTTEAEQAPEWEKEVTHLDPKVLSGGEKMAKRIPGLRFDGEQPGMKDQKATMVFTDTFTGDTFYVDPTTGFKGVQQRHAEKRKNLKPEDQAGAIAKGLNLEFVRKSSYNKEAKGGGKYETAPIFIYKTPAGTQVTIDPSKDNEQTISNFIQKKESQNDKGTAVTPVNETPRPTDTPAVKEAGSKSEEPEWVTGELEVTEDELAREIRPEELDEVLTDEDQQELETLQRMSEAYNRSESTRTELDRAKKLMAMAKGLTGSISKGSLEQAGDRSFAAENARFVSKTGNPVDRVRMDFIEENRGALQEMGIREEDLANPSDFVDFIRNMPTEKQIADMEQQVRDSDAELDEMAPKFARRKLEKAPVGVNRVSKGPPPKKTASKKTKSVLDQLLTPQEDYEAIEITDFPSKGFILPDGQYLGVAGVSDDHGVINGMVEYPDDDDTAYGGRSKKMFRIMEDAELVRFIPEANAFQFKTDPTSAQIRAITRYIRDNRSAEVEFKNGKSNTYTEDTLYELEEDVERGGIRFARRQTKRPDALPQTARQNLEGAEVRFATRDDIEKSLKKRGIRGDDLLDQMDKLQEISDGKGEVDSRGYVTLYHRTSKDAAKKIVTSRAMTSKEDGLFFSTRPEGQAEGYGDTVVKVRLPIEKLEVNDIFGEETHLRYPTKSIGKMVPVGDAGIVTKGIDFAERGRDETTDNERVLRTAQERRDTPVPPHERDKAGTKTERKDSDGANSKEEALLSRVLYREDGKPAPETPAIKIVVGGPVQQRVAEFAMGATGKPVVLVETDDQQLAKDGVRGFDGFWFNGKIYLNVAGYQQRALLWTAGHEWFHSLSQSDRDYIMDVAKLTDEGLAKRLEDAEEFGADIVGEIFGQEKTVRALAQKNPVKFKRLVKGLLDAISAVIEKFKKISSSETDPRYAEYITNAEEVRDRLIAVLDKRMGSQMAGEMAAVFAERQQADQTETPESTGNRGTFDPENPDIRFARRQTPRDREAIVKPDVKATTGQNQSINTTYYQINDLQRKRTELKRKLGKLRDETLDARIRITEEIERLDEMNRDKVIGAIYDYANRIGLRAERYNMVDRLMKTSKGKTGLLRAVEIMDNTLERRQHTRFMEAARKVVADAYTYLNRIQGSTRPTTDLETNRALRDYLTQLTGGTEEEQRKASMMTTYYNEYGSEDLKKNRRQFVDELGEDVVAWIEGDTTGPIPDRAKQYIKSLASKGLEGLSNTQLVRVVSDLKNLRREGRTMRQIQEMQERERFNRDTKEIAKAINAKSKQKPLSRAEKAFEDKKKRGILDRVGDIEYDLADGERIIQEIGGERGRGLFKRSAFDPLYEADTKKKRGTKEVLKWYNKSHKDPDTGKTIRMADVRQPHMDITVEKKDEDGNTVTGTMSLTIARMMKFYAHSMNLSQREHLIWTIMEPSTKAGVIDRQQENEGKRAIAEAVIDKVVNELPEKYKTMVRETWKYYDTVQWERINKEFIKEHGIDMPKEKYYFPIRNLQLDRPGGHVEADLLARAGAKAGVSKGFTKSRVNSMAALGRSDYFDDLTNNILQTEHYVAFNNAVRQVSRVLNNSDVKSAIMNRSPAAFNAIDDWLKALAYGRMNYGTNDAFYDKIIRWLRGNYAVWTLGLNPTSVMMQTASLFRGASAVKPQYVAAAAGRVVRDYLSRNKRIDTLSAQQEFRMQNYEQGIREWIENDIKKTILGDLKTPSAIYNFFRDKAMLPMGVVDKFVSDIVWDARYQQEIDAGKSQADAVYEADRVVRQTQSGGGLLASSKFQRGAEWQRMFTQFLSDPQKGLNQLIELKNHLKEMDPKEAAGIVLLGVLAPAVVEYIVRNFRPPWDEPEEVGKTAVNSIVSAIPIFGMVFEAIATIGLDAIKKHRGVPVNKFAYNYISDVSIPLLSPIADISGGVVKGKPEDIAKGLGGLIGVPAGGPALRAIKGTDLAIKHGNARYLITSKYKVNSEFDQVAKAERTVPSASRSQEEAKKMHEWASKQRAGWSPKKLLQYKKYTETTRKMKTEENRKRRQPK